MYIYITENNLENRQSYMYSKYEGISFLDEYVESRSKFLLKAGVEIDSKVDSILRVGVVASELEKLLCKIGNRNIDNNVKKRVDGYVKSFEVRKRLYNKYFEDSFKPVDENDYYNMNIYILFAKILIGMYKETKCLKYFSCLLKLDDTLISVGSRLSSEELVLVKDIIRNEMTLYNNLLQGLDMEGIIDGVE